MIHSLIFGILLTLVASASGSSGPTDASATRVFLDWDDWRESRAFGLNESLYLARLRGDAVVMKEISSGEVLRSAIARGALKDGKLSSITSDRDSALYFLVRTRGGGPTQVFRFDIASGNLEVYWSGEISGVITDAHFLPEPNVLVIVTQNFCYLVGPSGSITNFGPATHAEAPWFFSTSAASSRALALNLNEGLVVYEPGARPKTLEEREQQNGVQEMASVGDQWVVLHFGSGPGRLLRHGPETVQDIAAPRKRYLRVSGYGGVAVLWAHDSSELLFIGTEGTKKVDVDLGEEIQERDLNWTLIKGYSSHSVFLIDEEGYWTVRIPQSLTP